MFFIWLYAISIIISQDGPLIFNFIHLYLLFPLMTVMLMMVLVSGHQHWYMGMMDDIITNAAEECATDLAHASRSCHY